MKSSQNKKLAAGLFWLAVVVVFGGMYLVQRSVNASTATTSNTSSSSDIQLKVRDQAEGETGPATSIGSALQPSVQSNNAVDTSPACNRQGTGQAQVQGGACADQEAVKGMILSGQ